MQTAKENVAIVQLHKIYATCYQVRLIKAAIFYNFFVRSIQVLSKIREIRTKFYQNELFDPRVRRFGPDKFSHRIFAFMK